MGPSTIAIKATSDDARDLAAAAASGTPPTIEQIGKIAARYDLRPV